MRNQFQQPTPVMQTTASQHATKSILFLRFSITEQVLFAKRLSFLIKAGITVLESMTIIRNQTKSKRKQRIFNSIIADISAGQYLSSSLAKYRQLFGSFTINIIRIGEQTGMLSENLIYLAQELSKRQALQRKIRSALMYPLCITIATLGVTGLLVVFIFPKIMPIFISLDITLPLTTRILLAISAYLTDWGLLTICGIALAVILFSILRTLFPSVRTAIDWTILKLPIVGNIARAYNCANFCRTLGLAINTDVNIIPAMQITADVIRNTLYKHACFDIAQHSMQGENISLTMIRYPALFPDMLPHMVLIGEKTGSLSQTLGYLSDHYEAEVDEGTKNLSNAIEPVLLMIMGTLVGLIAVSIISPIYEVTRYLSNGY